MRGLLMDGVPSDARDMKGSLEFPPPLSDKGEEHIIVQRATFTGGGVRLQDERGPVIPWSLRMAILSTQRTSKDPTCLHIH